MTHNPFFLYWDFDGTLAELPGGWAGVAIAVLDANAPGHGINGEQIQALIAGRFPWDRPEEDHRHLRDADLWWQELIEPNFEWAFQELGIDDSRSSQYARQIRPTFLDSQRWHVFDDTVMTLKELSARGFTHVMISNFAPELNQLLVELDLKYHFTFVFNSAAIGLEKPNPDMFRHVLRMTGRSHVTWMIGDSYETDILGAQALKIPGILVRNHEQLTECQTFGLYGVLEFASGFDDVRR
jgi:putative hydrolase of the HAD superfamily